MRGGVWGGVLCWGLVIVAVVGVGGGEGGLISWRRGGQGGWQRRHHSRGRLGHGPCVGGSGCVGGCCVGSTCSGAPVESAKCRLEVGCIDGEGVGIGVSLCGWYACFGGVVVWLPWWGEFGDVGDGCRGG